MRSWKTTIPVRNQTHNATEPGKGKDQDRKALKNNTRDRGPRRPRFGFDVVLPQTQIGADTTDLNAFGVPLKLVAAQDIGGRASPPGKN